MVCARNAINETKEKKQRENIDEFQCEKVQLSKKARKNGFEFVCKYGTRLAGNDVRGE